MALLDDLLAKADPAIVNLTITQGDTHLISNTLEVKPEGGAFAPVDLTGCTVTAVIKSAFGGTTLATYTCTHSGALGGYRCILTPAATAALVHPGGSDPAPIGVYDVQVTDGTNTVTLQQGTISLRRSVTP
jgi:hypothetical protein